MALQYQVNTTQATLMNRKKKNGTVETVETNRDEYSVVPQGYYRLKLNGISEPFEMDGQYGKSTNLRLEWEVTAAMKPSGRSAIGSKFTDLVNFQVGAKSNLGLAIMALTNKSELEPGDLLDYLGMELEGPVNQTSKPDKQGVTQTYNKVAYDSVTPVADDDEDETPAPAKKATGSKNPILDDED